MTLLLSFMARTINKSYGSNPIHSRIFSKGEAIVSYKLTNKNGAYVQFCNIEPP